MKHVLILLILLLPAVQASVGTYVGETEKQGPEAELRIGFAAEREIDLELDVGEREGLNYSVEDPVFNPDEASRSFNVGGESVPAEEFSVNVSSVDVDQEVYSIPVTVRAFEDSGATQIVHEREYVFDYETGLSPGYTGPLVPDEEDEGSEEQEEVGNDSDPGEENGLTEGNRTQDENREDEGGFNTLTLVLLSLLLLVVAYIARSII